jgi:D-inositol-3-phosphate glycosyltransferase
MPEIAREKAGRSKRERCERDWVDRGVAVLTGGHDASYVFGLTTTLSQRAIRVHVVGNDRVDNDDFHKSDWITFFDCGHLRTSCGLLTKLFELTAYYARLIAYVTLRSPKLIHILWNNKAEYFDRTLLTVYFKCLGKKIVLTAHNVNKAKRDSCDSALNRLTLGVQYRLADQIFVHTEKMKSELVEDFGVSPEAVVVIPFGVNIAVRDTGLIETDAKRQLGIRPGERTILFFGRIVPYKGLECLVGAFHRLAERDPACRLIIAGEPMMGSETYMNNIRQAIASGGGRHRIFCRLEFIPDDETEVYFKAADVLVLPYRNIFESGIVFLAYRFGLPLIASDVGSFREELRKSGAGLIFESGNSAALVNRLSEFFRSDLYKDATKHRQRIREYSIARQSWEVVGEKTERVYSSLLGAPGNPSPSGWHLPKEASKRPEQCFWNTGEAALEKGSSHGQRSK